MSLKSHSYYDINYCILLIDIDDNDTHKKIMTIATISGRAFPTTTSCKNCLTISQNSDFIKKL